MVSLVFNNGNRVGCERPYLETLDTIATKHVWQPILWKENHVKSCKIIIMVAWILVTI